MKADNIVRPEVASFSTLDMKNDEDTQVFLP